MYNICENVNSGYIKVCRLRYILSFQISWLLSFFLHGIHDLVSLQWSTWLLLFSEVVLYWELGCYCDVQSCVSHCAGVNVILTNMDSGMLEDENIFFINCLLWIQFSTVNHHHYQHDFIICVCCVLLMWSAVISKAGRKGSAVGLSHIDRSLEPSSASSAPPSLSLHHKCNQNNHNHNHNQDICSSFIIRQIHLSFLFPTT